MKDFRNSRSRFYVNRDNLDVERPFIVVESTTNNVIKRCETSEKIVSEMTDEYNSKSVELQDLNSKIRILESKLKLPVVSQLKLP